MCRERNNKSWVGPSHYRLNRGHPGITQKWTTWEKVPNIRKEIPNISTLVDRNTWCPLAQHTPISFHKDTLRQISASQWSWNLEISHPNSAKIKTPPHLSLRLSDHAKALDTRRVQVQTWIKALCFYIHGSVSLFVWCLRDLDRTPWSSEVFQNAVEL